MSTFQQFWEHIPGGSPDEKLLYAIGAVIALILFVWVWLFLLMRRHARARLERRYADAFANSGGHGDLALKEGLLKEGQAAIATLRSLGLEGRQAVRLLLKDGRMDQAIDMLRHRAEQEAAAAASAANRAASATRHAAHLYRQLGAIAFLAGPGEALQHYAGATQLSPNDPAAWNQAGLLQLRAGNLNAAADCFQKVLGSPAVDRAAAALATGNLGLVHQARGETDRAETMFREALVRFGWLGKRRGKARQYANLGHLYLERRDLAGAGKMFRKALALHEALKDKEAMASAYSNLGEIFLKGALLATGYQRRRGLRLAETKFRFALKLYTKLRHKEGAARNLDGLGRVYLERDNPERDDRNQAQNMLLQAQARLDELHCPCCNARDSANWGRFYEKKNEIATACTYWRKARDLWRQAGNSTEVEELETVMRKYYCPN